MSDQCIIVAFDPGQTTGWCVMGVEKETLEGARHVNDKLHQKLTIFKTGQIECLGPQNGWDAFGAASENRGVDQMLDIANTWSGSPIVFEDFIIDFNQITKSRSALSPVTVMAKFEMGYQMYLNDQDDTVLDRMFRQNRSPVMTTCTDDRLKLWGIYDRNSGRHARDATRHAFYFLRNCRGSSIKAREARWRAWPHFFDDPVMEEIKANYYRRQNEKNERKDAAKKGTRIDRLG